MLILELLVLLSKIELLELVQLRELGKILEWILDFLGGLVHHLH